MDGPAEGRIDGRPVDAGIHSKDGGPRRPNDRVCAWMTNDGTVVAGGELRIASAVVSRAGVTLQIGGGGAASEGLVKVPADASVQEVAAGLHAAGPRGADIAAVFESLRASGALHAEVVVR